MYRRFLAGYMRDHLPISEVPLRLEFRPRADRRKFAGAVDDSQESSLDESLLDEAEQDSQAIAGLPEEEEELG